MQYGLFFDQSRCNGCLACAVACQDYHDLQEDNSSFIRIKTIEKGKYPDPYVVFLPLICYHCGNPACIAACPADAINKDKDNGIVTVVDDTCLGRHKCGLCIEACPYGIPDFSRSDSAPMQKCDLCKSRWAKGKKPICVEACPMLALDAGPVNELAKNYRAARDAEGFIEAEDSSPSIVYKSRKDARNRVTTKVTVVPQIRK
jgi:anaerobic dimethyl sulfoxide reductase subunit B (iron-sulfur subunit)